MNRTNFSAGRDNQNIRQILPDRQNRSSRAVSGPIIDVSRSVGTGTIPDGLDSNPMMI
jgi:hypothetical protein